MRSQHPIPKTRHITLPQTLYYLLTHLWWPTHINLCYLIQLFCNLNNACIKSFIQSDNTLVFLIHHIIFCYCILWILPLFCFLTVSLTVRESVDGYQKIIGLKDTVWMWKILLMEFILVKGSLFISYALLLLPIFINIYLYTKSIRSQ